MDKNIWARPEEAKILGGLVPLGSLLKGNALKTLFHDLKEKGHTVIAWSQRRPVGKAEGAVRELSEILSFFKHATKNGIILVGHSRGGLIAKRYIDLCGGRDIVGLLTICTPHTGSNMARWALHLGPLAKILRPLIPEGERGGISAAINRSLDFLQSDGVREVLPGSEFLSSLKEPLPPWVYAISAGGTNPALFKIGGFSFPELLLRALPDEAVYEELKAGKGDGLVSAGSSRLPGARGHLDFPVNHLTVLFDSGAREALLKKTEEVLSAL